MQFSEIIFQNNRHLVHIDLTNNKIQDIAGTSLDLVYICMLYMYMSHIIWVDRGRGVGKLIIKTNKGNLEKLETLLLGRNKIKVLEKGL